MLKSIDVLIQFSCWNLVEISFEINWCTA